MDECTWYAGQNVAEVEAKFKEDYQWSDEQWNLYRDGEEIKEILAESYDKFQYFENLEELKQGKSFRQKLNELIETKHTFPCFFASTEY